MGEHDKSVKAEKEPKRRLSFANRLRLYGSLLGTVGLIALVSAGCGDKGSSGDKDGAPKGSGNTPGLSESYSDEEKQDLEDYVEKENEEDKQATEGLSPGTVVDVELYSGDGADTYTDRMSAEEMKALCEEQRQDIIEEAEATGSELIGGPIVIVPYTVVGSGQEQHDYTCGQP